MDLGCYSLHAHRVLARYAGGAPRLIAAYAGERAGHPEVDEWLTADLEFPNGATGRAHCDMAGAAWRMIYRIIGTRGEATAMNYALPHLDDRVIVRTGAGERVEELGKRSSYTYQLEAVAACLRLGTPFPISIDDAVDNMQLIDDCYRAAGFAPRPRRPAALSTSQEPTASASTSSYRRGKITTPRPQTVQVDHDHETAHQ